jgi:hypothetical protein
MFRKSNKNKNLKEYKITLYGEPKIGRCYTPCNIPDDFGADDVMIEDNGKDDKR